jgi:hypothetical protein
MYHLDPVGRLVPSSLDVSRAASARHAHVAALREPVDRPDHAHGFAHVIARVRALMSPMTSPRPDGSAP